MIKAPTWREQETGNKKGNDRRARAEETLEKEACKYANSVPLKWRWRGDRTKKLWALCDYGSICYNQAPYGWSLWNGEISVPQGQPWWQWRSQTMGVTDWDAQTKGDECWGDRKEGKQGAIPPSVFRPELKGFLIMLMGRWWWNAGLWPSLTTQQRAITVSCGTILVT